MSDRYTMSKDEEFALLGDEVAELRMAREKLRTALVTARMTFDGIVGTFANRQAFVMQGARAFVSAELQARRGARICKAALAGEALEPE